MAKKKATAKKNTGGRLTKYKPEYCGALIKFFDIEPYTIVTYEDSKEYFNDGRIKKESKKARPMPNKMPTFFRFAQSMNVSH
jgi:hypothetical protein